MDDYLGVVVEDSLRDRGVIQRLNVVARRRFGAWAFALVHVAAADLSRQVAAVQVAMASDDAWYCHFFRGDELVVVFGDAVFWVGTDPGSWGQAIAHGLAAGVPREQLDFHPRTREAAEAFFGVG